MEDAVVEQQIFSLLARRKEGATICPSEVARALSQEGGPWRDLMPGIRHVAEDLVRADRLVVTRGGVAVRATAPGGPIRLGLPARQRPQ